MLQALLQRTKHSWRRALSMLLVLLTVIGMLPAEAFAADAAYKATGDFEVNIAGSTGWNGTCQPLPVYDSENGDMEIVTVPASDDAEPVPFVILEDNGGDRVQIGLVADDDSNVIPWTGGAVDGTGWVDKAYIFINLPDILPSIAYNLTNADGSIFTAADGTEIPDVTGHRFYAGKQMNLRLDRKEYIVPCMYTLAQRLAKVQKSAMANGETLVIYETFRPAEVQAAVRDGLAALIDSNDTVAADMEKASGMGYGQNWFTASGTFSHLAGLSVDMTLAKGDPEELYEYTLDGAVYKKYEAWAEYDMPSAMHELCSDAIRFQKPVSSASMPDDLENWTEKFAASEGAKRLQKYCTDAGLIPLASEYWHFSDPNMAEMMGTGKYSKSVPIHTAGNYMFDSAPSISPSGALGRSVSRPARVAAASPTGGAGGLNPGSPGGQKPTRGDVAWTTDSERTFLRFTLIEFPEGVVTDLNTNDNGTWKVKGTPLNVVWGQGHSENWDAAKCRSDITWFNSNAMQYNGMGSNAPDMMGGTVYAYDATAGYNQRWVTTADEFQAATGISDYEKSQMFHCHASDWADGWTNGDYTSMWGYNPQPVTPGNEYTVYTPNKAFLYLLSRLTEIGSGGGSLPGWSEDVAIQNWSEFVHDKDGNLRTKYRIIIETGGIFRDPDGNRRAYTLREMMAYSLYNNEPTTINHLIYDQSSTIKNMAQYMRQRKDNQFLEYPLDSSGTPTGEELHSTNGFKECDSFVDSITSPRTVRDKIFSERRSFGLHILSPFNFERPESDKLSLEVTKKANGTIPGGDTWGFTVNYTAGTPNSFTAKKNNVDCTSEVTETGSGLKFTLKADEMIHIDFDADASFRFEVVEDDPTYLTSITGTGGTADMTSKKFTSSGGESKVTFTNGTTTTPKKPVYLKLMKVAKEDKHPLSGAVFSVYADAACSGTPLATMTSGTDGSASASIPDIVEDGDSITLYVKETTAPAGCTPLGTTFTATCKAPENSTAAGAVQVGPAAGIENGSGDGPDGPILYKRDAMTNKGVGPVTFKFSSVTNGDYEFTTDENGGLEFVQWWDTTEKDGRYIKPGEYAVTEIVPPPGYEPTTEVQQIKLELDDDGNGIPAGPLVFKNLAKVGLRVVKYDRQSHKPMKGVTFEIFRNNDSIGRYETDANGEIILTGIEPGTYRAVEVDTGDDIHILDLSWQEVELVAGGSTKDLFFFNDVLPGMKLIKVDSADPSKTISGVKFSIKAVDGSYGPQEFVTDNNGEIDLSKLPTGAYVVTELECSGYVIDDAQRIIHLRANETAEFVFTNTKKPGFRLIKTSADGTPLDGVTFRISKIGDSSHYLDRTTENGGEIFVEDLEPGVYSVQETATLPDHILDETERHVELFPGKTSEIRLKNDKRPKLIISKRDKDTGDPVPGVTFTLRSTDGPTITTKPTGADGKIVIENLLPGVYTVTEQSVPEDYILDTSPQTVTLFPNKETQVEFQNHQRPSLKIVKVDIEGKHLTGALFEVKTKAGVKIGDYPVDANGEILVPKKHLAEGYYIITEIQAPAGYILDPTPHEVYLRPGKTTEVSIENEKKPGLTIMKIDSVVGDGVKGAKFEIWVAKDKNQYGTYQKLDENYYYTDESGIIHIDNLDTGWYKIKEVEPPTGYMLKEPSEQIVYVEHDKTAVVTFENIPKSALIIRKIDADTGKPLAGAWFRIRYLSGTSGSGGTIVGEYQTSSNGNIILTDLDAGTYIVEEINAPDGYVIDVAPQTAYISGNSQDCITLTFTNSKKGALLIKKIDSVTKEPMSDVRFFITTSDGAVVGNANGYFTTDSAGTILINDIEPGTTLVVKEVETRPGYILDDVPQTVKIESNETKTLEFRNQPKGGLIIRKIDSATGKAIPGVEFKITKANGELLPDNEGMTSSNGIYTTDGSGQIVLSKVSPGTYIVTEVKTLEEYILDATPQTAVVNAGDTKTLTFRNTPKGALVVWKYDSVTSAAVKDAVFQIKNITAGAGGNVIGTYKTSANGSFTVTDLDAGTYVVEEIASDSGHVIDAAPQTVNISGDKKEVIQLYFGNAPKGNILIKKIDSVTHEPLSGVEFVVTNSDGTLLGRYTTDSTGNALVESVAPGTTLIVKETRAKDGYILDDAPRTAVVKAGQTVELEFRNQPTGSLLIRKVCSVNPSTTLKNAEFRVAYSDGTLVGNSNGIYRTDENGEIRINNLIPGKSVVITETKAPAGFLIDTQSQTIMIQSGKTVTLTFKNQPTGKLIIQKRDSDTNDPLPGAQFRITTAAGCEVGLDGVIGTATLTQNGIFTTDSNGEIRITNLAPGAYVLTEVKAPAGYVMDEPSTNVVIGTNGDTQTVIVTNTKKGGLIVEKYDSVTKQPLSGARFKIITASGELVPDNEGLTSSNGLYTTDRNGQIVLSKLLPGTYVVAEDSAPNYYRKDPTPQTVVVNAADTQTVRFYDDPLCTLTILKRDAVTKKPLAKAEFLVRDSEGKAIGPSNGRYITGTDGTVTVTGLEPNATIVVSETKAPAGYILDETPQNIVVRTGVANSLIFDNQPGTTLVIKKFIEGTENEPLSGVAFKVIDGSGAAVGPDDGVYYTDKAGEIVLSGIEPGTTVTAREIKTVEGFVLDGTPQNILIKGGEVQSLTFWNKRDNSLTILKQSTDKTPLTGAVFHVTDEDGAAIGTNNGRYTTDRNGLIIITGLQPGQVLIVTEEKAPDGYVLDITPKTIKIKQDVANSLIFENARTGKLVINKYSSVDRKAPLEGVTFKITTTNGDFLPDENGKISSNGLYHTDSNGQIMLNSVVGSVVVTEVQSIDGYTISDANRTQTVEVKPDDTQTLYFYNDPLCSLTITKVDSVTGKPVPNTEFTVKDSSGSVIGKYTTGKDGTVTVTGLVPNSAVVVTETRVPAGYVLNSIPQTIQVKNGTGNDLTSGAVSSTSNSSSWSSNGNDLTFENDPKTTLTIEKYLETETGNQPLKGVTFLVTDSSGAVVGPDNGEYVTGEDGRIVIRNLEPGVTVTAREIKVPEGVILDSAPKSIQIKAGEGQTLRFVNKKAGTLVVQKLDKISKTPLAGVEFELTYAEGGYVDDASGHLSSKGRYTTNDAGEIRLSVTGTVVVKEIKTLSGYVIDSATQTQTVKVNPTDTQTLVFYNEPMCSLTLTKRDAVTGKPVPNTEFTLKDGNGNILGKYMTGSDGTVTATGFVPGSTVIAVETKVPAGYVLDSTPKSITVQNGTGNSIISGSTLNNSGTTGSNDGNRLDFENNPTTTLIIRKFINGTLSEPLSGVAFKVVDGSGAAVGPDGGTYHTNAAGEIVLNSLEPGISVTAREIKTVDGFVLDGTPQTIQIKAGEKQQLTFWNKRAGALVIQKKDKLTGKPLAGVEFQVTDANGDYVPDENGHISSNGLYYTDTNGEIRINGVVGTLVVKETKTIAGYTIDETARTQTVTVNPEDVQTLTFYNTPSTTLVIEKYAEGTTVPLKDAVFLVTNSSGAFVGKNNGEYTTDENGRIEISGLTPGETITAKEIKSPEGYVLDGTPKSIRITEGEAHTLKFYNASLCSLTLTKKDSVTGKPVPGTEFTVKDGNGSLLGSYTTGKDGTVTVTGLVPGSTVVVTETKVPKGYVLDPTPQTIVVKKGTGNSIISGNPSSSGGNTGITGTTNGNDLTFENDPTTTLVIQKLVDGTENQPLQGVEFFVTDGSGEPVGRDNGHFITDQDGRITISDLEPGTSVTAKEAKTVPGYVLDSTPQTIQIKTGEAQTLRFYNKKEGNLVIKKLDARTKAPLAGVEFLLTYSDGSFVDLENGTISSKGIYTTDRNGQITISGVSGTITVTETKTIDGYVIEENERSQTVTVNPNDTQTLTFYNTPKQTLIIQKLVTGTADEPLAGVEFLITDNSGAAIGPNNGIYKTDRYGRISLSDLAPGTVITAKETKTVEGYVLDGTPQSMEIKSGEVQTLTFYNSPIGGLELIKVSESDKTQRIPGVTFEVRKSDGGLVGTVTTGDNGRVFKSLDAGDYHLVEIEAAKDFKLDATPHYFTIKDGETTTLTVTNKPFSGILIHKIDSVTKKGIYGVTFLLYDGNNTPVNQFTSDQDGYVYVDTLELSGKVFLREMENKGYQVDTQLKTVYVKPGETTEITWENTPITGQIQITKTSADYNSVNGWSAGTALPNTIFEIYDRASNLVDTIKTDKNGIAKSKPLPLGRYTVKETQAAEFYGLESTVMEAEIEFAGQIVRMAMTNKSLYTNVSITKRGYAQVMPGQSIKYDISNIGNNSTTALTSFYWRDTLPTQAVRLDKIVTGTYNVQGNYKIVYKTNLSGDNYRTLADSLSTQKNYVLAASPAALGLASNECVTEFMAVFGVVPGNFRQVEQAQVYCNVLSGVAGGSQFVNQADVGGVYNGQWIMATDRWVTAVYKPSEPLPRTGY